MIKYSLLSQLPGGNSVIEWFGRTPNFHDAEIVNLDLRQSKTSSMGLHL